METSKNLDFQKITDFHSFFSKFIGAGAQKKTRNNHVENQFEEDRNTILPS